MKLRNKKTGEIKDILDVIHEAYSERNEKSLMNLEKEWEEIPEEPKEWWYIDIHGPHKVTNNDGYYQQVKAASKEIGNYFETKEEAELAVEKLKAVKRLKDKGFRFEGWDNTDHSTIHNFSLFVWMEDLDNINKDLDLLFSQEEK